MTNYEGLEAGSDLDLAIAVEVMQWEQVERWPGFTDHDCVLSWIEPKNGRCYTGRPFTSKFHNGKYDRTWERWEPSTSIEAAFTVVGKLQEIGFDIVIWTTPKIVHTYRSFDGQDSDYTSEAQGDTVAHAICRAALLAVAGREG